MARQNIDGTDFVGGNGRTKLNDNFTELYLGSPYPEDTFTDSTPLTSYREGVSAMRVSAAANFCDINADGSVLTIRTGNSGSQIITSDGESRFFREWINWIDPPNYQSGVPITLTHMRPFRSRLRCQ